MQYYINTQKVNSFMCQVILQQKLKIAKFFLAITKFALRFTDTEGQQYIDAISFHSRDQIPDLKS